MAHHSLTLRSNWLVYPMRSTEQYLKRPAGIGGYQPYLDRAAQFAGPGGAQQFMNPFENQVVQQTMKDIAREGAKAQNQLAGSGVASGAFGGSRFGVAQAGLAGKTLEQQARSAGQIRQQGFQQAQQAAQNAARLQAGLGQAQQQMGIRMSISFWVLVVCNSVSNRLALMLPEPMN